ncbi:hypothetical protein C8Q73DRAFT_744301 [Cubamyces lactineus]|nr:hypothetical protein C8Q73DRAFT_744301 [Cubamyces lactineus]
MWLKSYLDISPKRPTWALLADSLMSKAIAAESKHVDHDARVNSFLQTWKVSTRAAAGLPVSLRNMVKAARKHGLRVEANNPSRELREAMPAWYHIAEPPNRNVSNSKSAKCLREKHMVRNVAQAAKVAERIRRPQSEHVARATCECLDCRCDKLEKGCDNPARCAATADKRVQELLPVWNPNSTHPRDGLSLTPGRKVQNQEASVTEGRILFDPSIAQSLPIAGIFRIFTDHNQDMRKPGRRPTCFQVPNEAVEVYTDGSCIDNGSGDARAGSGIWFGDGDERNTKARVPYPQQSNQTGEIYAVMLAHHAVPPFAPLHITGKEPDGSMFKTQTLSGK